MQKSSKTVNRQLSSQFFELKFWAVLLWVCNETDAQLIISKYKKNTIKKKKSFI